MENKLQIFNHAEFGEIRAITIEGEPWFVAKDVATRLEYTNPQKAARDHVDEEDKTVNATFTVNGTSPMLINESGVYSLVFSCKLPEAKKFKHWVTREVLPAIRKTGSYGSAPQFDAQAVAQIAAAVCAEVAKQLLVVIKPQTAPGQPTDIHELFEEDLFFRSGCKLERAPAHIRKPVDEMFYHMIEINRINFSAIVRFCRKKDFEISNPAVRHYYDSVICATKTPTNSTTN